MIDLQCESQLRVEFGPPCSPLTLIRGKHPVGQEAEATFIEQESQTTLLSYNKDLWSGSEIELVGPI